MVKILQHIDSQIFTNQFLDIEKHFINGELEKAIEKLNLTVVNEDDFSKREFLLGYANKLRNNYSIAMNHFLNANTYKFINLSAALEAIQILCKNGYIREAAFFINEISTKFHKEKLLSIKDLEKIYYIFDNYKNKKIIAIHQPAYIPWLGYFHKIFYADKFVVHDAVQFSKKSFIKRTLIRKSNTDESTYLTIPAKKHSDYCLINEIIVSDSVDWRTEHIRKIESAYKMAPHFQDIFPLINSIYESTRNSSSLVEITFKFTLAILEILDIKREIHFSSALLNQKEFESPHQKNMELCKILEGSIYFSGDGARNYQDDMQLPNGINLIYQNFWNYLQKSPYVDKSIFINGLSILDALFYIGPKKINELFTNYENPNNNLIFS